MPEHRYDFGLTSAIAAEAIGEPGNRTFRLLVRGDSSFAVIWMEKEQLQALALAAEELLAQIGVPRGEVSEEPFEESDPARDFPAVPEVEFKIGQLGIGYDQEGSLFVLLAYELEADPEAPATLRCVLTRPQLAGLGRQSARVVAAGRPRCVLCGQPLEPAPHFCPPSNGHGVGGEETH
jgi:uncharacterized repeat protein (TIGR03847 family)